MDSELDGFFFPSDKRYNDVVPVSLASSLSVREQQGGSVTSLSAQGINGSTGDGHIVVNNKVKGFSLLKSTKSAFSGSFDNFKYF
ncbi:hypothetical protein BCR33DRAFT_426951 [Rhizoclosmatium globosum]|uniref:Uncharacterized protein n=1 Tax=Rhizoclosmatium globosum TaxID=329046 RepID=A0A1Y2BVE4_9FUNG|nr:hypothetical protein BCR33DRAFT_426951 [Rhizoclosmatium globosum]|eukprot:ORY38644.1 hypothetical protein BCR33DRAFT_426951 [Rhizoclosmatium globosum]